MSVGTCPRGPKPSCDLDAGDESTSRRAGVQRCKQQFLSVRASPTCNSRLIGFRSGVRGRGRPIGNRGSFLPLFLDSFRSSILRASDSRAIRVKMDEDKDQDRDSLSISVVESDYYFVISTNLARLLSRNAV